ncbi:MAG: zinc ABC transporter substrate-binding protein [Lachnospiraceae bacterium]|nr:zinc ABC transporter substrate-binding protein [Lachnospiraceae bacterium]
MKRIFCYLLAAILMAGSLSACNTASAAGKKDTLQIIATIFPEYDWVKNILGDNPANAELSMLLDNGVDLHSFQPTAADIINISTCDLFIYVGGESDEWVEDALKEAKNKDMVVINLLEVLGDQVKEEEIVEGMDHEHEHHHDGEVEYDEHVWLSLRKTKTLCDSIESALCKLDPANADTYKANNAAYQKKLGDLDAQYGEVVKNAKVNTLLFGDRFPFRYLLDDYDLKYYAAFAGCSAETEASFETILFLSGKVDELGLPVILTIEGANHKIAQTVKENTKAQDQKILVLNSLQSTTSKDVQNGVSYLSVMEENLSVLKEALGE